jgi:hypothetical protein
LRTTLHLDLITWCMNYFRIMSWELVWLFTFFKCCRIFCNVEADFTGLGQGWVYFSGVE